VRVSGVRAGRGIEHAVIAAAALAAHGVARAPVGLRLAGALQGEIGRTVDLVVLNDAPPLLGRHVVTHGRRVFCRDAQADHVYVCDVQLRAADLEPWLRRMRALKLEAIRRPAERDEPARRSLAELRRHLAHLRRLRPRVSRNALERDLSLHNDVLFSLLTVCQLVIDVAGELAGRRGDCFEDYTEAARHLARDPRFPEDVVRELERLPDFRNVLIHEYVALDLDRVVDVLDRLDPVERFMGIVAAIESEAG
jgi:uncharacterized protein YutE (UPF0331/DUF86 family)